MPQREFDLATTAGFRPVAWPRYDVEDDLEIVFGEYGRVLNEHRDVTLCLLHDPSVDVPIGHAAERIGNVLARTVGEDHKLDILLVDDIAGSGDWKTLRTAVNCALALPSSTLGHRAEFLERLGLPVLNNAGELQTRMKFLTASAAPSEPEIRCGRRNLFLVGGDTGQGKSSLVFAFCDAAAPFKEIGDEGDSAQTRTTRVILDRMYVRYVLAHCPHKVPSDWGVEGLFPYINEHYEDQLDAGERAFFLDYAIERIETALGNTDRHVVVEGWHLLSIQTQLETHFAERVNVIPVAVERHTVRIGERFEFSALVDDGRDVDGRECSPAEKNLEAARAILDWLEQQYLRDLLPRTTYQCFDDLGQPTNNSNSRAKLDALSLPDLSGTRVLDIGCNAGYFALQMRRRGAAHVHGIDYSVRDIEVARCYQELIYDLDGVEFERVDVFDLEDERRYDLVLCLSVFHYFRARQREFFSRMHRMLAPAGLIVLECGLSQVGGPVPFVEQVARGVDGDNPCHFPNRAALIEMANGFKLTFEGPSILQPGDAIPRSVLHLRKIPLD